MTLYGWTAWWERVCRHEKIQKIQKISIQETNQSAKLSFMNNFSTGGLFKMNEMRTEEKYTPRIVQNGGSTTPKRLREEDNISILSGEIEQKFLRKQKMSFSENQNFLDCGGGETATISSNKKNENLHNYKLD